MTTLVVKQSELDMFTKEGTDTDDKALRAANGAYMITLKLAMVAQGVFGFLALLFNLIQLDTLGTWNIAISQSIIMGLFWAVLLIMSIWGRKNLSEERMEAVIQFMVYYTLMYTVTIFWEWFFLKLNYANATHWHPPTETNDAFMGYVSFNTVQIFFTFFFEIFALQLLNSRMKVTIGLQRWIGLNKNMYSGWIVAFKIFTIVTQLVGMVFSFLYFFFLLGYPVSSAYLQMWLFVCFAILYLVQLMLYFGISRARDASYGVEKTDMSLVPLENFPWFQRHWDELDATQMFLFIAFFVNIAVWITIWSNPDRELHNKYKFATAAPDYYAYIAGAIFNSILLPWFGYYVITSVCFASWVVSVDDKTEYQLANLGPRSLFTVLFRGDNVQRLTILTEVGEEEYSDVPSGGWRLALQVVLLIGLLFQFVNGVFTLVTLINTSWMAHFWYDWSIIFICFEGFFWIVYAIKIIVVSASVSRSHQWHKNMLVFCNFFRPMFTFTIAVFELSFGFWELWRLYGSGGDLPIHGGINDHTKYVWVQYWGFLTIVFGVSITLIFVFKDIIGSMLSGSSTFVIPITSATKAKYQVLSSEAYSQTGAKFSGITSSSENS